MEINILGEKYEILKLSEVEYPKLRTRNAMGLAEVYAKKLIINTDASTEDDETYDDLAEYEKKVIRHEIIHAFFHESGMTNYSSDEYLVEWVAQQLPKIFKSIDGLGLL